MPFFLISPPLLSPKMLVVRRGEEEGRKGEGKEEGKVREVGEGEWRREREKVG